jgi:hypothetical protein
MSEIEIVTLISEKIKEYQNDLDTVDQTETTIAYLKGAIFALALLLQDIKNWTPPENPIVYNEIGLPEDWNTSD